MAHSEHTGLIEEGQAFADLTRARPRKVRRERVDVVVIGGGQAGLSVGYHLQRRGVRFVILDACERTGDVWRARWDSLRLFTPAKFDGLDGMPFPAPKESFPTKDEMADYLEAYVRRFALPVRNGKRVDRLSKPGKHYLVEGDGFFIEANQVVVAMASYQKKRIPAFASELAADVVQLHSSEYRGPSQLADGSVLLVGAGNSGAEIAKELAGSGRTVYVAGRDVGEVPFDGRSFWARFVLLRLVLRFVFHRVLTIKTPMGRRARAKAGDHGVHLIRVKRRELAALGVQFTSRLEAAKNGLPALADGTTLDVRNVVWCTGFHPGFSWIDLPVFGSEGGPEHDGGIVRGSPGLYFVGLHFLYSMSSTMIHGVGRDAERIARTVKARSDLYRDIVQAPVVDVESTLTQ